MQGCSQLSGVIQAILDYQKIKRYYWRSRHISPETKNDLEEYFSFCPLRFCLPLPCFILLCFFLFLPPSSSCCVYDADEGAVASVQSLGLFCADVTAALHNLCLSCFLQSHLLWALTAVRCTYETSPAKFTSSLHSATRVSASSVVERNVETTCTNYLDIILAGWDIIYFKVTWSRQWRAVL